MFKTLLQSIAALLARLRVWLDVRLGLWRGQWRRGRIAVPDAKLFPGPFGTTHWSYALYCPRALRDDEEAPLVLLLHGCKQRALGFAEASGWRQAADARRFRLLCPEQRQRANVYRCWNWFVPAAQRGEGELALMRALLDETAGRVSVSTTAVVGLSAGGGMAALLAFHAADRVHAAVAVAAPPLLGRVSAQDPLDVLKHGLKTSPALALNGAARPAPLLIVHGRADAIVAARCAEQLAEQALRAHERSGAALDPAESSGAADALAPAMPGIVIEEHRQGGRLQLRVALISDLPHAWSGGSGGHPYVQRAGASLTTIATQFLVDAGALA